MLEVQPYAGGSDATDPYSHNEDTLLCLGFNMSYCGLLGLVIEAFSLYETYVNIWCWKRQQSDVNVTDPSGYTGGGCGVIAHLKISVFATPVTVPRSTTDGCLSFTGHLGEVMK